MNLRVVLTVLIIYLIYSLSFSLNFKGPSKYDHLTDAFAHGQFHLRLEPPKELIKLKNPYNPYANLKFRANGLNDFSLYKEKLYLYFGPTPVVILLLPIKLLTGKFLPSSFAITIFMIGAFIFYSLTLAHIRNKYFKETPKWLFSISELTLALGNIAPYLIGSAYVYQIAIACGCFCISGSTYFLIKAFEKKSLILFALAGLFAGLATGSRLSYVFCCIAFMIVTILASKLSKRYSLKDSMKAFGSISFSIFLSGIFYALYNLKRFGSIFDFGGGYELGVMDFTNCNLLKLENIIPNIEHYLLKPLRFNNELPFANANISWIQPNALETPESIVGIIHLIPIILVFYFAILIPFLKVRTSSHISKLNLELLIILLPSTINFIILLTYSWSALRYFGDFISPLILTACIFWIYLNKVIVEEKIIKLINITAVFLATITIIVGNAIALTAGNNGLY